jgi:hypothetical protein
MAATLRTACALLLFPSFMAGCNSSNSSVTETNGPQKCKGAPSVDSGCVPALFCEEGDGAVSNINEISGQCSPPTVCPTTGGTFELSCVGMTPDQALKCIQLPVKADANVGSYCCPCQQ